MTKKIPKQDNVVYSCTLASWWKKKIVLDTANEEKKLIFLFTDKMPKEFDLTVHLKGYKSRAEVVVAFLGRKNDETIMNIRIIHDAPETYGRVTMKAALFDEARIVFKGMLEITSEAKGSDSYLLAKALLVSPKTRAEIYPYLEIKTDEIKASHGSSVGRIDEGTLFYLQSRGIQRDEAEKIILSGFFGGNIRNLCDIVF